MLEVDLGDIKAYTSESQPRRLPEAKGHRKGQGNIDVPEDAVNIGHYGNGCIKHRCVQCRYL